MHHGSEQEHGNQEAHTDGSSNHDREFIKCDDLSSKQENSWSKGGNKPAQNRNSHFFISLLHLCRSRLMSWMHGISWEMDNVINWEPNKDDHGDWLWDTDLPTLNLHHGEYTNDYHSNAEERYDWLEKISCSDQQNCKCENCSDCHASKSWWHESLLCWHECPKLTGSLFSTFQSFWSILSIISHILGPFLVMRVFKIIWIVSKTSW